MEYLVTLWGHCQTNQRGEFWKGADADYVEMICNWDGEAGVLFRALVECGKPGFIVVEPEGLRLHDWAETNSQTVYNWARNANGRKGKKPTGTHGEPTGSGAKTQPVAEGSEAGSELPVAGTHGLSMVNPRGNPTGSQREANKLSLSLSIIPSEGGAGETTGLRFDLAQELVGFLNQQTGAKFRGTSAELTAIAQCLARVGNDAAGCRQMIARQVTLWRGDAKSAQWLRPTTLFDDQKFDGYYAQRSLPALPDKKNAGAANKSRPELLEELSQARATGNGARIRELETLLTPSA